MAHPEHIDKLQEGIEEWNQWRAAHREIKPDLREARLQLAHYHQADLSLVDLTQANLGWARLTQADLSGAQLIRTQLLGADLSEANLSGANLSGAHLTGANLSGADLLGAQNVTCRLLATARSLHRALLDPGLLDELTHARPHLLEAPDKDSGEG